MGTYNIGIEHTRCRVFVLKIQSKQILLNCYKKKIIIIVYKQIKMLATIECLD